jgi:hypothetical protein
VNECPGSRVIFLIPMACEIEKLYTWLWFVPVADRPANHRFGVSESPLRLSCWFVSLEDRTSCAIDHRSLACVPAGNLFPRQKGDQPWVDNFRMFNYRMTQQLLSWLPFYPWTHGTSLVLNRENLLLHTVIFWRLPKQVVCLGKCAAKL